MAGRQDLSDSENLIRNLNLHCKVPPAISFVPQKADTAFRTRINRCRLIHGSFNAKQKYFWSDKCPVLPLCLYYLTFSCCTFNNSEVFYFIIIVFSLSLEEPEIAFAIIDSRSEGGYTEPIGVIVSEYRRCT